MSQPLHDNLFKSSLDQLPPEKIAAYLRNELSSAERHEIEKLLQDSELHEAALEGYAQNPDALNQLGAINQDIKELTQSSGSGSLALKVIAGAALAAAVVALFWLWPAEQEGELAQNTPAPKEEKTPAKPLPQDHFLQEEAAPEPPKADQEDAAREQAANLIDPQEGEHIIIQRPKAKPVPADILAPVEEDEEPIEYDPIPEIETPSEIAEVTPERKAQRPTPDPSDFIYIFNHRTYDYSEVYENDIEEEFVFENGVPASFENEDRMRESGSETRVRTYAYEDVLEAGIFKLKKRRYKQAIQKFNLILGQFPEDQNALFYGGFANFHLGEYEVAIKWFDQVISNPNITFHEEAEWYKAKSLLASGETAAGKELLKQIIDLNGFYAEQAKAALMR